jgi:hypothetical protein
MSNTVEFKIALKHIDFFIKSMGKNPMILRCFDQDKLADAIKFHAFYSSTTKECECDPPQILKLVGSTPYCQMCSRPLKERK